MEMRFICSKCKNEIKKDISFSERKNQKCECGGDMYVPAPKTLIGGATKFHNMIGGDEVTERGDLS